MRRAVHWVIVPALPLDTCWALGKSLNLAIAASVSSSVKGGGCLFIFVKCFEISR